MQQSSFKNRAGNETHALSGKEGRRKKAEKIKSLLAPYMDFAGAKLLDVGGGAGWIAHFLQEAGAVSVVTDVKDQRADGTEVSFAASKGTSLPFEDIKFDVVLYNHVIEHVGAEANQRAHLAEIKRVLKPDGVLYVSVPNKWALVENHYGLPFLSWLPKSLADRYMRLTGKASQFDCVPLSRSTLKSYLIDAGFHAEEVTLLAAKHALKHEVSPSWLGKIPFPLIKIAYIVLSPIISTITYIARQE